MNTTCCLRCRSSRVVTVVNQRTSERLALCPRHVVALLREMGIGKRSAMVAAILKQSKGS